MFKFWLCKTISPRSQLFTVRLTALAPCFLLIASIVTHSRVSKSDIITIFLHLQLEPNFTITRYLCGKLVWHSLWRYSTSLLLIHYIILRASSWEIWPILYCIKIILALWEPLLIFTFSAIAILWISFFPSFDKILNGEGHAN